jgi:SPX domain protein involved in polyphosphate accumulation
MQKSLLITIVLILVVYGQNNEQESANNTVYNQFMMKVDQKLDTVLANVLEQFANVLERLDRIESCQNNVQSVPGMH